MADIVPIGDTVDIIVLIGGTMDIGKTGAIAQRIDITRPQKTGLGIDKGMGREPIEMGAMTATGRIPGGSFFQAR